MEGAGAACVLLAEAAGAAGMAGGQAIDLAAVGKPLLPEELDTMHRMKTGAMIRASVQLGARCGRALVADEVVALDSYGMAVGLAFQVVDDLLDVEGSTALLGKTAGKDAAQGKVTYASLLGPAEARRRLQALHADAHVALRPFGVAARRLAELTDWIVARKY
jgi:farnesyl diphosphate synthase